MAEIVSISDVRETSPASDGIQPESHNGTGPPADWATRRAELLPPPTRIPPDAPAGNSGGASIPPKERLELVAGFAFNCWLMQMRAFRVRELWEGVLRFKDAYRSANALGTYVRKGVAGHGLGLRMTGGELRAVYFNAHQLMSKLSAAQTERVYRKLGFADLESFAAAIRELPDAEG